MSDMPSPSLERRVRYPWLNAVCANLAVLVLLVSAFQGRQQGRARFTELDVERLNVIGADGKYAVVIASPARMPGNIMGGREYPRTGRGGGILFYNQDGNEAGGLIHDSQRTDSSVSAFGQLSIDRLGSDQVVALRYLESSNEWLAGLQVWHFPRDVLSEWFAVEDTITRLHPTAQRAERAGEAIPARRQMGDPARFRRRAGTDCGPGPSGHQGPLAGASLRRLDRCGTTRVPRCNRRRSPPPAEPVTENALGPGVGAQEARCLTSNPRSVKILTL